MMAKYNLGRVRLELMQSVVSPFSQFYNEVFNVAQYNLGRVRLKLM